MSRAFYGFLTDKRWRAPSRAISLVADGIINDIEVELKRAMYDSGNMADFTPKMLCAMTVRTDDESPGGFHVVSVFSSHIVVAFAIYASEDILHILHIANFRCETIAGEITVKSCVTFKVSVLLANS